MEKLYDHTDEFHNTRAAEIVVPHILDLIPVASVLDVGCGTGTWLKVFNKNFGLTDLAGLDGSYVDRNQLVVDQHYFKEIDLRQPFDLQRKFDLVLCLEVAEHLPEACAETLVSSLCKHSDAIIFSSAIPGQGGQNHLNEQWPAYWQSFFLNQGYFRQDAIRSKIWNEENVDVWYRQNIFLFVKKKETVQNNNSIQMAEVHPVLWKQKIEVIKNLNAELNGFDKGNAGIKRSFKALGNALIKKLKGR